MKHSTPPEIDLQAAAEFAREVVRRLQSGGYQALWAGGCVRDYLLGVTPKDYDVATNATPEQVRDVFGRRRTLFIGASFGVVTVRGPRTAGHVEVATFRRDEGYSDGRHPDHVTFSSAIDDAQRRDFTINGLFFDPLVGAVFDYVEGRADLDRQLIRAIGDPHRRFDEDKLRMLRAVRFATTLGFAVDPETQLAMAEHADELERVSSERIVAEMRRVLTSARASRGLELLQQTGLWHVVLPEYGQNNDADRTWRWNVALRVLDCLGDERDFVTALAAVLWPLTRGGDADKLVTGLASRWRLPHREVKDTRWLLGHYDVIRQADKLPWAEIQPLCIQPQIVSLLRMIEAVQAATDGSPETLEAVAYCRSRLAWAPDRLNPPPLVGGDDLKSIGIQAGREMGDLLARIRTAQLAGDLTTPDQALAWAKLRTSEPHAE